MKDFIGHVAWKVFLWALNMDDQQYRRVIEIQIDEDKKELAEEGMAGDPGELADETYEEDLKALKRLRFWQSHNKSWWLDPNLPEEKQQEAEALDKFDHALDSLCLLALGKTTKQNHEDILRSKK